MKLTENQIKALYKFTRQHYVYHYDVQTELVDHLANDIEEIWEANPLLSFEDARDKSFKKFGVFGFMDVIEAKQKQMNKRYWKILWRFTKEWFTLPKALITLSVFISIYMLLQFPNSNYFILGALSIGVIAEIFTIYKLRKQQKVKEKNKEKLFFIRRYDWVNKIWLHRFCFYQSLQLCEPYKIRFFSFRIVLAAFNFRNCYFINYTVLCC
jgi:uncharacterized membrane-anchored protein YhcB (DUF1043 family)